LASQYKYFNGRDSVDAEGGSVCMTQTHSPHHHLNNKFLSNNANDGDESQGKSSMKITVEKRIVSFHCLDRWESKRPTNSIAHHHPPHRSTDKI